MPRTLLFLFCLLISISVSAIEIPLIGDSGPVGQPITGVGITSGEGEMVSCIQTCILSCTQKCTTTSCGSVCGENCADKCLSGAGLTTGTTSSVTKKTDVSAYCGAATTCDQCRNRPAYRCAWAGACVPCTGASCIISCDFVPKKTIAKITNIVDDSDEGKNIVTKNVTNGSLQVKGTMPYVKDPKEEDFIVDPNTGELIYIGDIVNETNQTNMTWEEVDRIRRPNYYKYSNSTISKIMRGIESFFSWIFS